PRQGGAHDSSLNRGQRNLRNHTDSNQRRRREMIQPERQMSTNTTATRVRWPDAHAPEGASIYVSNHTWTTADPELVWAWLTRPQPWRRFYSNAKGVRHRSGPWPELAIGTRFSWVTFGALVTTEITEFEPFKRLAWTGTGLGATAHHAWLLEAVGPEWEIVT